MGEWMDVGTLNTQSYFRKNKSLIFKTKYYFILFSWSSKVSHEDGVNCCYLEIFAILLPSGSTADAAATSGTGP